MLPVKLEASQKTRNRRCEHPTHLKPVGNMSKDLCAWVYRFPPESSLGSLKLSSGGKDKGSSSPPLPNYANMPEVISGDPKSHFVLETLSL